MDGSWPSPSSTWRSPTEADSSAFWRSRGSGAPEARSYLARITSLRIEVGEVRVGDQPARPPERGGGAEGGGRGLDHRGAGRSRRHGPTLRAAESPPPVTARLAASFGRM